MAKLVLGKTPQDLEAERAKKQRELEASIQEDMLKRQSKVIALHRKQKINTILIIAIIVIFSAILIVFGTYNTFFKKGLQMDEVQGAINQSLVRFTFNDSGLDEFIRLNCENWFMTDVSYNTGRNSRIDSISVDPNSIEIFKVRPLNGSTAEVYYSFDVIVAEKDTTVTDQSVIELLRKNGFGKPKAPTVEQSQVDVSDAPSVTEEVPSENTGVNPENNTEADIDTTIPETETPGDTEETPVDGTENITEAPVVATNPSTPSAPVDEAAPVYDEEEINIKIGNDLDYTHFYILSNGTIMQKGETTSQRYMMTVTIEYKYLYANGENAPATSAGYFIVTNPSLYSLEESNQQEFSSIEISPYFAFDEATMVDEVTLNSARVTLDKTFSAIYSGQDVSKELNIYKKFIKYDGKYNGIDELEMYNTANARGYNARISYNITTSQGFNVQLSTYLTLEPNGNSWTITNIY